MTFSLWVVIILTLSPKRTDWISFTTMRLEKKWKNTQVYIFPILKHYSGVLLCVHNNETIQPLKAMPKKMELKFILFWECCCNCCGRRRSRSTLLRRRHKGRPYRQQQLQQARYWSNIIGGHTTALKTLIHLNDAQGGCP